MRLSWTWSCGPKFDRNRWREAEATWLDGTFGKEIVMMETRTEKPVDSAENRLTDCSCPPAVSCTEERQPLRMAGSGLRA